MAFFYRPLFNNETFFFRDLYNHFYPQKKLFAELVLSGQIPLWDPYRHGGQPFLANMNNSALYPTNLLYLILAPITAFNVDIVLHVLLAALSAYLLCRILGFNQIASLTSGFIFAFSGPALSIPNVWLYAPVHLPLMLAFWHLYCIEQKKLWIFLFAFIGAIQVFAGRPEMPAITAFTVFLWTLVFPYSAKSKKLLHFFLMELSIVGLASIQLIPMLDLVQQSSRGHMINLHSFFAWSVDPRRLPEVLIPNFLGSVYSLLESDFWGRSLEDLGMPYILSLYFGVPVLLLAIISGISKTSDELLPRKIRMLFLIVIALSFFVMAGRHISSFRNLVNAVPAITIFRYPVKFIFLTLLPLTLLAGYQLHQFLENPDRQISRFAMALILAVATTLTIFACYCWLFPKAAGNFLTYYFGSSALYGLRNSISHAAAGALLLAIFMAYRTIRKKPDITAALSILIALDLLIAGTAVNQFAPREFLTDVPDLAAFIKKEIGVRRLYRDGDYGNVRYRLPSKESVYVDRWRLELLSNYTATLYNIPVIFHEDYDWLSLGRMVGLSTSVAKLNWEKRVPIFSSASVRFVLTAQRIRHPELRLIRIINNASNTPYYLYKNEGCAPRAAFISNAKTVSSPNEALRLMTLPSFDPCITVLLEEEQIGSQLGDANATVKALNWRSNSSTHLVNTDKPGFLVFSEPFTNGWRWKVDGWNVKPIRANYAFSAVQVPAGKHYIYRTYRPVSFVLGCTVSLLTLVAIVLVGLLSKTRFVENDILAPLGDSESFT
jgi:hypothetical protein